MTGPEEVMAEVQRSRRRDGVIWIAVAMVLALTLGVAYRIDARADRGEKAQTAQGTQIQMLQGQVQSNGKIATDAKAAAEEANRRLKAAGQPTVPVPSQAPVSPPATPANVGVSVDQVRLIVAQELADQNITITQAEVSQIARAVQALKTSMPAQISTTVKLAVAAYCLEDRCVGRPGTPGQKGDKGDKGDPAPKVTDEELLRAAQQALLSYCGQDTKPCQGTPGTPGKDGTDGADGTDGRGIADTDCLEDGTWRITYTDNTTQIARGPCRVVVGPTEQPAN